LIEWAMDGRRNVEIAALTNMNELARAGQQTAGMRRDKLHQYRANNQQAKDSETVMSFPRSPAVAVWLLAGAGAYNIGAAWADDAQTGKLHPWVLLAVFWGVALLSVSIHYLLVYLAQAAVWARRRWHQQDEQRARLRKRARLAMAHTLGAVRRSVRQLAERDDMLARAASVAAQAWFVAARTWDATRRAWEQQVAGARRAPGALVGWSRSALKFLRVAVRARAI
jgi:hypothetical protein